MKKSLSKTRKYHYILYIVPILSILTALKTSALTYQSDTNIDFTINPTISMTLSGDLIIDNLTPGSSNDSNIIEVGVSTNASHGYYLSATVGSSNTDTNLTNSDNSNYAFTNLSSNASSLSNFSDNEWGYSYSTDGGTNWISGSQGSTTSGYNGLPLDNDDSGATGITLVDTNTPLATNQVKFKIGAKASNTQASGTYTNTINFYAITHQAPLTFDDAFAAAGKTKYLGYYTMQDMTSNICQAVEQDSTAKLIDIRDNQIYTVVKLLGNCWMTKNLNLAGETTLSSDTSNVSNNYTLPTSSTSGFSDNATAYVYNSDNTICNSQPCYSYYSYTTATAGTNPSSGYTTDDICPKNWRLPNTTEFTSLTDAYPSGSTLVSSPFMASNAGYYSSGTFWNGGKEGRYWLSKVNDSAGAWRLYFYNTDLAIGTDLKSFGLSIRCLAK